MMTVLGVNISERVFESEKSNTEAEDSFLCALDLPAVVIQLFNDASDLED